MFQTVSGGVAPVKARRVPMRSAIVVELNDLETATIGDGALRHPGAPVDLTGKVAIVTGSGRGLGLAYAAELARGGAAVVVNDVDAAVAGRAVEAIAAGGGKAVAEGVPVGAREAAPALGGRAAGGVGPPGGPVSNARP